MGDGRVVLVFDAPVMADSSLRVFAQLDRAVAVCGLRGDDFHDEQDVLRCVAGAVGIIRRSGHKKIRLGAIALVEPDGHLPLDLDATWSLLHERDSESGDETTMPGPLR